jgi:hypothetical protein
MRRRWKREQSSPAELVYKQYQGQPQGVVVVAPDLPGRRSEHYKHELDRGTPEAG